MECEHDEHTVCFKCMPMQKIPFMGDVNVKNLILTEKEFDRIYNHWGPDRLKSGKMDQELDRKINNKLRKLKEVLNDL